ncbi:MAG TPA: penicillin-binding protein 1C [Polyangiaceae bacterium]|nr:penicillin-binding protein 1C [Polyangiaceae bacterium]
MSRPATDDAWRRIVRWRAPRVRGRRAVLVVIALFLGGLAVWRGYRSYVGGPEASLERSWHAGHRIVARDGSLLRELPSHIGARGTPLPLESMGDRLVLATLTSEDKRFYEHAGVDLRAIVRASAQNLRHLRIVSGASTVTQQLVKLLDTEGQPPDERRSVTTKVREAARAQNLEETMSKRAILEAYLNRLNYGRGVIGPAAAAETFFGVSPQDLSWAQAAALAVLPRAPSFLDPYKHPERSRLRQRALLDALRDEGFMSDADHARAIDEPLRFRPVTHPFEAPHLTEALRLGKHGGLTEATHATQTTLDLELQRDLEALVETHRVRLQDRNAHGAAVLVIDNESGEVLAYLGNADWGDDAHAGQVDLVRARRQPGSTLKPFVYAMAFEAGRQPSSLVADVPTRFGEEDGSYSPANFDGSFQGPISAREALAGSLNVPAVRLAAELPPGSLLRKLRDELGMTSLDRDAAHYGLALALGSGEVTLAELATAYVALARGGVAIPLRLTVSDASALGRAAESGRRVFDEAAVAAVIDALSDPLARVRGLGNRGPFDVGFPVAVKTGTSSGYRDTWAVGFTRERTVAVWVGNADGRATRELTGGSGAGPLFADAIRRAMRDVRGRRPLHDEGLLDDVLVCPLSGQPVGPDCPEAVRRKWIPRTPGGPTVTAGRHDRQGGTSHRCAIHRRARPMSEGYRCDERAEPVVILPSAFDGWLASQPPGAPGWDPRGLPWLSASEVEGCGTSSGPPRLVVVDPPPGSVLLSRGAAAERVELVAHLRGARPFPVEFVVDGDVVARSDRLRAHVPLGLGDHVLEVRPVDPAVRAIVGTSRFSVR